MNIFKALVIIASVTLYVWAQDDFYWIQNDFYSEPNGRALRVKGNLYFDPIKKKPYTGKVKYYSCDRDKYGSSEAGCFIGYTNMKDGKVNKAKLQYPAYS